MLDHLELVVEGGSVLPVAVEVEGGLLQGFLNFVPELELLGLVQGPLDLVLGQVLVLLIQGLDALVESLHGLIAPFDRREHARMGGVQIGLVEDPPVGRDGPLMLLRLGWGPCQDDDVTPWAVFLVEYRFFAWLEHAWTP